VDDVTILYRGASEPESSMTLYFEEVLRVAVPVWRQTTIRCLVEFIRMQHQGQKSNIYDERVCMTVFLTVRPHISEIIRLNFAKLSVHVARGSGWTPSAALRCVICFRFCR